MRGDGPLRDAGNVQHPLRRLIVNRRDEVLEKLRYLLPDLRARYGVTSLSLFGSVARGDQSPKSDVDILVDYADTPSLFAHLELEAHLSDALGGKVDLVMRRALKPRVRSRVESEALSA